MEKVALYVQAVTDTAWLEKKVENPNSGRMVKVKSLPPELQKQYRPKNKDKMKEHTDKFKKHLDKAKSLYKSAMEETGDSKNGTIDISNMKKFLHHVNKAKHHVEKAKKHGFTETNHSKAVNELEKHVNSGDFAHKKLQHHIKQMDKHLKHLQPLISKSEQKGDAGPFGNTGLTGQEEGKAQDHHEAAKNHFESAKFVRGILKKMNPPHPGRKTKLADYANKINSNGRKLEGWTHDDVDLK